MSAESERAGAAPGGGGATAAPELTVEARIRSGSNAVFVCSDQTGQRWVYKPVLGERPLYDFPEGSLAGREVAAYLVSEALGWGLVPETVTATGPGGTGMAQRWIDIDPAAADPVDVHPVDAIPEGRIPVLRGEDGSGTDVVVAHDSAPTIRRLALFDEVINNADRKGGHLLVDADGRVWGIDHGLAFHVEPKVRTVLWGWAGRALDPDDLVGLSALADALGPQGADSPLATSLGAVLDTDETDALRLRVAALVDGAVHPSPVTEYPLPWPLF